jgi:hypothetical protein
MVHSLLGVVVRGPLQGKIPVTSYPSIFNELICVPSQWRVAYCIHPAHIACNPFGKGGGDVPRSEDKWMIYKYTFLPTWFSSLISRPRLRHFQYVWKYEWNTWSYTFLYMTELIRNCCRNYLINKNTIYVIFCDIKEGIINCLYQNGNLWHSILYSPRSHSLQSFRERGRGCTP